ncbi:MAG: hypothetical protein SOR61_09260 [Evtepia sp.]|uniref:hypothetical protein n=1 Tax=Evtepia sp. TaxID=2773933 RepID=UPI002A75B7EB|nr:hypothetical protein [Evtepia sp.]MDY3015340.1 hypothetical protein [Evtepia sp.]
MKEKGKPIAGTLLRGFQQRETRSSAVLLLLAGVLVASLSVWLWTSQPERYSVTEARRLAYTVEPSWDRVRSGELAEQVEKYARDQFPLRDGFRNLKGLTAMKALGQKDLNHIYTAGGYCAKMEYPLNRKMIDHAADTIQTVYDTYLKGTDTHLYLGVVPAKDYYLAPQSGHLYLDYEEVFGYLKEQTPYLQPIEGIRECLSLEDYYKTDSHWRQEKILDVADRIAESMGVTLPEQTYTLQRFPRPFHGTYANQLALPLPGEELYYLTSPMLDQCVVTTCDIAGNERQDEMYTEKDAYDWYPYNLFLSGAEGYVTVYNPLAETDRELVLFRDSFGSSLGPLLASGYRKITLVDLRYLPSTRVGEFLTFQDQDVLFLYSTLLLCNSLALR